MVLNLRKGAYVPIKKAKARKRNVKSWFSICVKAHMSPSKKDTRTNRMSR